MGTAPAPVYYPSPAPVYYPPTPSCDSSPYCYGINCCFQQPQENCYEVCSSGGATGGGRGGKGGYYGGGFGGYGGYGGKGGKGGKGGGGGFNYGYASCETICEPTGAHHQPMPNYRR